MAMTPEFWRGRSVLVTGHTGFKGSWLSLWLQLLGARVAGIALDPCTTPNLFEQSGLAKDMPSIRADIREAAAVEAAFREHKPEIVFHMAAQSLVRESYREPVGTFTTNVIGTVNCLEASRNAAHLRAVVVVTTDKCYRNRGEKSPFRETDELGGDDPYSASKAAAELATEAYRKSFFGGASHTLVATARAGNVIGGGDWAPERLVPDAMRSFASAQAVSIRNPDSTRPWQHVLEPLRGYLVLAERLYAGERTAATGWNFGPELSDVRPVSWVVDALATRWGGSARWESHPGDHPHEAAALALDNRKARSELGWKPALPLGRALEWAVDWYKALASGAKARDLTLEQIKRYQGLLPQ